MLKSIKILLSIAACYDYEIWQMDVKTAFLNGNLEEEIYMLQPEGFIAMHFITQLSGRSLSSLGGAPFVWQVRFGIYFGYMLVMENHFG